MTFITKSLSSLYVGAQSQHSLSSASNLLAAAFETKIEKLQETAANQELAHFLSLTCSLNNLTA